VTSELIFNKLKSDARTLGKKSELLEILRSRKIDVLATIGAGDIDSMVAPIREMLLNR
jgi:UDP-N-acetylmuramate--alanine ligase